MGFNYAKERRKFEAKWRQLRKEYKDAGMDEYAIEQLYLFDLKVSASGAFMQFIHSRCRTCTLRKI